MMICYDWASKIIRKLFASKEKNVGEKEKAKLGLTWWASDILKHGLAWKAQMVQKWPK